MKYNTLVLYFGLGLSLERGNSNNIWVAKFSLIHTLVPSPLKYEHTKTEEYLTK